MRRSERSHERCRTSSDVCTSRRRKAARVNRPHRVLWRRGSVRRASQAGVNTSAGDRINNSDTIQTSHMTSSNTFVRSGRQVHVVPDWSSLQTARPSCTCAVLSSAHTLRRRAKAADSEDFSAICSRYGSTCADITEGSANTLASSCSYRLEHLKQEGQLHNTGKLLTLGFDQTSCVTQSQVNSFKPTLPTPEISSCIIFAKLSGRPR